MTDSVDVRERHSDTLGEDLLLVTVPVTDRGETIGALRVSAAIGEVESSVRSSWLALALIGLAVVAAGSPSPGSSPARSRARWRSCAGRRPGWDAATSMRAWSRRDRRRWTSWVARSTAWPASSAQPRRAARLCREHLAPAPHAADRHQAPAGGDPRGGRHSGGAGDEGRRGARPPERAGRRPAGAGAGRADRTPGGSVDLGEAVRAAGRRWAAPAAEAGRDLAVADEGGARIWAAPDDVAHMLDNLLENAIRYSPRGSRSSSASSRTRSTRASSWPTRGPAFRGGAGTRLRPLLPRRRGRSTGPGPGSGSPSSPS